MNKEEVLRKRNIELQKEVDDLRKQLVELREEIKVTSQFFQLIEQVQEQSAELEAMINDEKHMNKQIADHYKTHGFKLPLWMRIKMLFSRRCKR